MVRNDLVKKTFNYFDNFKEHEAVVTPSLPILYFGNLTSYKNSKHKILTVGKNPSDNEFRLKKSDSFSFVRFSNWNKNARNLIPTLNAYFDNNPLKQWFSCFEPILNGLSASFYPDSYPNTAIHTDVCSPLATNPTWSNLAPKTQTILFKEGFEIWQELIEDLQPDLMLVSIPKNLFKLVFKTKKVKELISFSKKKDGTPRKYPYLVDLYKYELNSGKKVNVVFGQAANKPFGTINNQQKFKIGELCQK